MKLLLLALAFSSGLALACDCYLGDVSEKYRDSASVFLGTVDEVVYLGEENALGDELIVVTFSVLQSWKGASGTVTLNTAYNRSSCSGYWFRESETYLVYAYDIDGKLDTKYCGGVVPTASAEALDSDVSELNA